MLKKIKIGEKLITPIIAFIVFWEIFSFLLGADKLPGIINVLQSLIISFNYDPVIAAQGGGNNGISGHLLTTFINCNFGLFVGICIGFIIAILLFEIPLLSNLFDPLIEFFRIIPPLIFIPFLLLLFDTGNFSQIIIIIVYSSYSMFIYSFNALRNIKNNYISIAKLFNTSRIGKVIKVYIPAILPELLGGIRVTSAIAFGVIIVSEYLGAPEGLGRVIKYAISYTDINLIIVSIVWVVLMNFLNDVIILLVIKKNIRWM